MKQAYHSNSTTNIRLREVFRNSKSSKSELSKQYGVSEKTVSKWRKREDLEDKSSRPHNIKYSLSELDRLIICHIRQSNWLPLDEIAEAVNPVDPNSVRSSIYRTFVANGLNKLPEQEKEKVKKFKEYDPGFMHVDITYLPKINGVKYYLFVAIDRATRTLYYKVYTNKTAENSRDFLDEIIEFFPFEITHILTDNGLEFTNRLLKSKKGKSCETKSLFTKGCEENSIDHRCTRPFTPKTNGMVEKANDTIKKNTVKISQYQGVEDMSRDLRKFLINYNLYKRHGSLRRELNVKTPFQAVEKWYKISPEIYHEKPEDFKMKLTNLA